MNKITVVILLLLFSACGQAESQQAEAVFSRNIDDALGSIEFAREPGTPLPELRGALRSAMSAMYEVAGEAESWEEAHSMAQEKINSAGPGVERAGVSQAMAKLLLTGYLVPNQSAEGASDLALAYTHLLVEHQSPEAETVLEVVESFGEKWNQAELRAVALGAAEAAEAHVEGRASCGDCGLPKEARQAMIESGQSNDVVDLRRLAAAERLRETAE